ncbi:MAG: multiheme c-type cytochrome [Candidatus Azotimanducaceae bacterium WSBS_2022_MAG_OTU7]
MFRLLAGLLTTIVLCFDAQLCLAKDGYVGSAECKACHQQEYKQWRDSDHAWAMLQPNQQSVLGDFSDVAVEFHDIKTRFYQHSSDYFIETLGDNGVEAFKVAYTFGRYPLQQYLIELDSGHLQAFDVAWDTRGSEEGGQRWFHLQPDLEVHPGSPFFWTAYLQNWNSRCAECHSTNLTKNYDLDSKAYQTEFSELNVACEACHGPAGDHAEAAHKGEIVPLITAKNSLVWNQIGETSIATASGSANDKHLAMCGGCHSRRGMIGELAPVKSFDEQFNIALIQPPLYHADGQILDEVFVLGSFLQSKMHARGVTCSNCHEPHSGKLVLEGNKLCAQCHNPSSYDTSKHLLHAAGSPGAACVDCHMPEVTYMQVDDRRDHKFGIPRPNLASIGMPNACNGCHRDKTPEWAVTQLGDRLTDDPFARLNTAVLKGDPLLTGDALRFILTTTHPPIQRATLLANLSITPQMLQIWQQLATDKSVIVRAAAVRALEQLSSEAKLQMLSAYMNDSARLVRTEVGRVLSYSLADIPLQDIGPAIRLVNEYRDALNVARDMPGSQTSLALLESNLGKPRDAERSFQHALEIEPQYIPALLNYADFQRARQAEGKAAVLLKQAVEIAPDSGAANFSYALSFVRRGKTSEAKPYFQAATQQADATPRYSYVYAVALESLSDIEAAIHVLRDANRIWPNQFDLLMLQVAYLEKSGAAADAIPLLRTLQKIAPEAGGVRQRLEHYGIQ